MKTLTKLQVQIVGTLLSISGTQHVFLNAGEVNSLNRLKERELVDQHCWGCMQQRHLKPELISEFFSQMGETFTVESLRYNRWLVFDNRKVVAKAKTEADAKRIVAALKFLNQHERKKCQSNTSPQLERQSREHSNSSPASAA
jgi:hypothetical protein